MRTGTTNYIVGKLWLNSHFRHDGNIKTNNSPSICEKHFNALNLIEECALQAGKHSCLENPSAYYYYYYLFIDNNLVLILSLQRFDTTIIKYK